MRVLLLVVAILVLASGAVQAQDVVPSISAGSKALLFSFSGLAFLNAGAFDGGVGAKYFLSENLAVRGGLNFVSASQTVPANPNPAQQGIDGSISATTIGVSAAAELHMGKGRVRPFLGGGAAFAMTSTENKSDEVGNPPPAQTVIKNRIGGETIDGTNYQGATTLSVFGLAGFEFFLYKEVSLSAEYRLGFTTSGLKDQEVTAGTVTATTKAGTATGIGFASSGALTLAVYL